MPPLSATGVATAAETARIAASPGLMIAVNWSTPNMPRLDTVNVEPERSSGETVPSRAPCASSPARSCSCGTVSACASRITGTTRPPGTLTAIPRCTRSRAQTCVPSVRALTSGNSTSVSAVAARTKSVTVRLLPRALSSARRARSLVTSAATVTVKCGVLVQDEVRRSAITRRIRDIILGAASPSTGATWTVLGAEARAEAEAEVACGADAAARANPAATAATMSRSTIRPPGPVPATSPASIPDCPAARRARGEIFTSPAMFVAATGRGEAGATGATGATGAGTAAAGTGAAAAAAGAGAATAGAGAAGASGTASPASPIHPQTEFTGAACPSTTTIARSTPSSNVSTSMALLSVSISNSTSPRCTASPTPLCQATITHSSVICPGLGIRMGLAI